MSRNLIIVTASATLLVGFFIGLVLDDLPGFTLQKEIQLGAVFGSLLTSIIAFAIAVLIPNLITKHLDDKRGVKQVIVNEIELYLQEMAKIRTALEQAYKSGKITEEEKLNIRLLFDYLDKRIDSICQQLTSAFPDESKDDRNDLERRNRTFWREITGRELMDQNYAVITQSYWKDALSAHCTCESAVRVIVQRIYKY